MKKTGIAFALLATFLMTCAQGRAQKLSLRMPAATQRLDLSKLDIAKILQKLQSTTVPQNSEETSPLQVVAEFLQLQPAQITELGQLLEARQAALAPLFQTAQTLTQQLGALLNSGGNPAQIGAIVIQIHALQQQMGQVEQNFLAQFIAILNPEQLQRLQAVQIAAQLQPILPAFQPIFLF